MKTFKFLLLGVLIFATIPNLQAQEELIYTKVENMPIFPSCETESDADAQKQCTDIKLITYISQHLVYPTIARQNDIQGLVVLSFVVNKEGKIEAVKVIKDIGGGCGEEAVRVVELMNEKNMVWTPGKLKGKAVKVKYHLPVRFKLEDDKKEEVNEDRSNENKDIYIEEEVVNEDKIYTEVELMPAFPSCEEEGSNEAQKECTDRKLLTFVVNNLTYPTIARENDIQGLVVVSFVIDKAGNVTAVRCVKDIGGGCGDESVRVVKLMIEKNMIWTPGEQDGEKVKVKYNLPVRFRLQADKKEEEAVDEMPNSNHSKNTDEDEPIFTVVENMPIFPSCETAGNMRDKMNCTDTELLKFVYQNLNYPANAVKNNVEGLVVVSFVVNQEGKVENVKCLKDVGGGCGTEAIRVIEAMNDKGIVWTPGTQRGKAVKVKYNLPIRFRLTKERRGLFRRRN
jgi:TonB family protein